MENKENSEFSHEAPHIDIDDNFDEYEKTLEQEMEKASTIYVDKLDLMEDKTDEELMQLSKEEIIQYDKIRINQLKAYISSLEKEKEELISEFKITTDALLEKIKENEFSSKGIRPQTPMIVNSITNNNKNIHYTSSSHKTMQRCPNCTKEFPIDNYIEHSLQCLRKVYRCQKCNITMKIEDKDNHFLHYQNKNKMIDCLKRNDLNYFKECIQHEFPINDILLLETGDCLIHLLVKQEKSNYLKIIFQLSNTEININIRNKGDMTPLMLCCKLGNVDIAKQLIQNGAKVNEKNILGDTPLKIAQMNNHELLALLLINNYKADLGGKKI